MPNIIFSGYSDDCSNIELYHDDDVEEISSIEYSDKTLILTTPGGDILVFTLRYGHGWTTSVDIPKGSHIELRERCYMDDNSVVSEKITFDRVADKDGK